MRLKVIEAEPKFVDEIIAECVHLARCEAFCGVVAGAILKTSAIQKILEGRWQKVAVITVAEAREEIVFPADGLV